MISIPQGTELNSLCYTAASHWLSILHMVKQIYIYIYIYACEKWKWKSLNHVRLFVTPWTLYCPWNSLGQNTGVRCLSLLQEIFPTQGLNPGLLHCRQILYQLSHKGRPRILEWVAYPFSSGSSRSRSWTRSPTFFSLPTELLGKPNICMWISCFQKNE